MNLDGLTVVGLLLGVLAGLRLHRWAYWRQRREIACDLVEWLGDFRYWSTRPHVGLRRLPSHVRDSLTDYLQEKLLR